MRDGDSVAGLRESGLDTAGPFPRTPLTDQLERRWLHYAFFSRDHRRSLVANLAWLGMPSGPGTGMRTAVLLLHDEDAGWACSQWNGQLASAPWSAFRHESPAGAESDAPATGPERLQLAAASGAPSVDLAFLRTSAPCAAQTAEFTPPGLESLERPASQPGSGEHWMRWQSEPGVMATGTWQWGQEPPEAVDAVGYHERVRGRWGWAEMGGWVFGFCNVLDSRVGEAPPWALVFTLLQPHNQPDRYAASLMVWRRGRLIRHFPRRNLRVSVAGQLDRDVVQTVPGFADLIGTPAMAPIPVALCIDGEQGEDTVEMRFIARRAARLVIPSESSFRPYSVHEVIGYMETRISLGGQTSRFEGPGIVEFAGGAAG